MKYISRKKDSRSKSCRGGGGIVMCGVKTSWTSGKFVVEGKAFSRRNGAKNERGQINESGLIKLLHMLHFGEFSK
jgi:hypothetical protein